MNGLGSADKIGGSNHTLVTDHLRGDGGPDEVCGRDGDSFLEGGDQDDLLIGGADTDDFDGGDDSDECGLDDGAGFADCEFPYVTAPTCSF